MKLIHYSAEPLTAVLPLHPRHAEALPSNMKPRGLWLSVDDAWEKWCRDENFALDTLAYANEIQLADEANILMIDNASKIDCFTKQFSTAGEITRILNRPGWEIDWHAVAKWYQGIIINPYIWQRRLTRHTMWYYGWDCASGCIWDGRAIAKVIPMEVKREHQS